MIGSPRYFRSKIDVWMVVPFALALAAGALAVWRAPSRHQALWVGAVLAVVFAVVIWTFLSTGYTVTDDGLVARAAFFRWTIRLRSIRSLRRTRNPLSSPALSLDRIEVRYDGGTLLVSPRDVAGFVQAIRAGAPGVEVDGALAAALGGPWIGDSDPRA